MPQAERPRSEFLSIAEQLFRDERRPMTARELVNLALGRGMFSDKIAGRTPHQTMKAKISVEIRRRGDRSSFVRTGRGRFYLRSLIEDPKAIYAAPPLRPPESKEAVLVFPAIWLDAYGRFQGVVPKWRRVYGQLIKSGTFEYLDRRTAETADEYKQVVTYVLVTRRGRLLAFKRGTYSRAEDFLKGSHCVGFGGHVTAGDRDLFSRSDFGIAACAARELAEELVLPPPDRDRLAEFRGLQIVGILNDDSSANGRRHLAIVLHYDASNHPDWDAPKANEKSVTQLRWLDPHHSPNVLFQFEYWSQLCLLQYYRGAEITRPYFVVHRRQSLRPPHLLVILGQIGSGKSELTSVLRETFGYEEVNSGRVMASELGMEAVDEGTRGAFQNAAWRYIMAPDGPTRFAAALLREANQGVDRVLIDGIRQRATLDALKEMAAPRRVGVVYVHTPPTAAFEFYRDRAGSHATIENFLAARAAAVEQEVPSLITFADAVVFNWKGRNEYRRTIINMMRGLGVQPYGGRV